MTTLYIFIALSGLLAVVCVFLVLKLGKNNRLLDESIRKTGELDGRIQRLKEQLKAAESKQQEMKARVRHQIETASGNMQKDLETMKKERNNLQRKMDALSAANQQQARELASALREKQELSAQVQGLSARVNELQAQVAARDKELASNTGRLRQYEADIKKYQEKLDHFVKAELRNSKLKNTVNDLQVRLNELSKIAEHNRIAWVVTQKQLEMAEDRIHMLLTGAPRPGSREHDPDVLLAEMLSQKSQSKGNQA